MNGPHLLLLALWALAISAQELVPTTAVDDLQGDLQIQEWMRELRRVKRAPTRSEFNDCCTVRKSMRRKLPDVQPVVVVLPGFDATRASTYYQDVLYPEPLRRRRAKRARYCPILVSSPPIPPPDAGKCVISRASGREICYPHYEDLDTTCTDVTGRTTSGLVAPPVVPHATVRAMAFVPPDNLRRLIVQYYRQQGKLMPKNMTLTPKSFLFVKYHCDFGYEMIDEVDTLFCHQKSWVNTLPVCRGKGLCEADNGGCSHSCLSVNDEHVECRCPRGMTLDTDGKTCIILRGPPKLYVEPAGPYEVPPGGNINITCSAVAYPFPDIFWQRGDERVHNIPLKAGTVKNEQILIIKELFRNAEFTCHANNTLGNVERTVKVIITGPGSAPVLRGALSGRTTITIRWDPPHVINRPITSYTVYYTNNGNQPIKNWQRLEVKEPNRNTVIENLRPNTQYFIRLRANDQMGPGRLGNPASVTTLRPASRPLVTIEQGEELFVGPLKPFELGCNITRADPVPVVTWQHKGRPLNNGEKTLFMKMHIGGVIENTVFSCVAENEAGKSTKRINITVTGPTAPERIRYRVDGDKVNLQWEQPRITNAPMAGYDVLYTDDPNLPEDQWKVHRVDDPHTHTATVSGLSERTPYTFRIRGRNKLGEGLLSGAFNATTWLGARPPFVMVTPPDQVVKEPSNDPLSIECEAIGVPKPKIIWLWSGQLVEDGKDEFRVYDITPMDAQERSRSKLIAQSTTRTGMATCQAVNAEGSDEKKTEVKILGPGSAPMNIQPTPMHTGFDVAWQPPKRPNGRIKNYIVYYTKDPDLPLAEWKSQVVDGDVRNLTVHVDDEDTPYVVKVQAATNDGPGIISEAYEVTTGRRQIPLTVRLEISDPPIGDEVAETEVDPAQPIHFKCIAEGRPMPSVSYSWLPMNSTESGDEPVPIPITPDPAKDHRYISIQVYSTTSTKRTLLCQARNPDGTVEDKHSFIVNKPGSPPREIKTIVDPDNRVTLTWEAPKYPNGEITSYKVYLTGDPSKPVDQWQVFEVTDPSEPRLVFERGELEPESPYYVKIAAVNPSGEGVHSDVSHFDTVSGAPLDSPKDILPAVAEDNTVNITWSGPREPNGPIKSYTIYFAPDDGTVDEDYKMWPRIEVPSTDDHGTITIDKDQYDIKPNTPYKVRISATNDLSEGPASEPTLFETGSGETPPVITLDPPTTLVSVDPKGSVTIVCSATGIPQPTVYWVLENGERIPGRTLQLTDLIKDTSATCKAENKAGGTQEVVQIQISGPGTPPNEIVLLPMPNQVINVEWTTPDEVNGRITNYIVHYGEVPEGATEPEEWKTATVDGLDVNHQLPQLDPKKNYAVRVQAVSDRGPGVLSAPQIIRTLPLAPARVVNPEINVFDNNSIMIEFVPPVDPESPDKQIKDFVILYTSEDPPTDETDWKELRYTDPDDTDNITVVPIDGENFNPDTKYHVKIIPRGEIDGPASEPSMFTTGDGVIAPSQPEVNVDAPDNKIRVPAGTDYIVICSSAGFPPPEIRWVDGEGNQLSDGPTLKLVDVRRTVKAKCLAENKGGLKETDFTVFVAGPGSPPENVHLQADKPVTITVQWDPPTIPNGNITKYIIYYTPLDDQDPAHQIGQVQSRPINEWLTYHDTPDADGTRKVDLKDFIETDTAYAVVVQAINNDGPGPYSNQYTIRTMSRAREGPPTDLRVEPDGQRSAVVEWKEPTTTDVKPVGYEIYYVPGDKSVDADDQVLSDWSKIVIDDPNKLTHRIQNLLQPDTDYVFKIRAIYPDGPSVFSEPCIMKTLPDGNAPYIQISTGENGVAGSTNIDVLPGSQITVSCNATGLPLPSVKWIRGGTYEIDPSTVDTAAKHAQFSLKVANITEDTTFNCVAQNPLGHANWTINVNLLPGLEPEWKDDFVVSKSENGEVVLVFSDNLPDYLKPPNDWVIRYTDNPDLPKDDWTVLPSDSATLTRVPVPDMEPGTYYYLVVDSPEKGIQTPTLLVMTPKPPSDIRVGTNINDESIVDFKEAITSQPVKKYSIKVWKLDDPTNVKFYETTPDVSSGVVLDGLEPDTDYAVQIAAEFYEGDNLPSEPVPVRTPPGGVTCDCAHACTFEEKDDGTVASKCYCHSGFVLSDDEKSCEPSTGAPTTYTIVRVTPPAFTTEVQPEEILSSSVAPGELETIVATDSTGRFIGSDASPLPTGADGKVLQVEEVKSTLRPTDASGRELPFVVGPDGVPLNVNAEGELVDGNGNPIIIDEEGIPRDPFGKQLPQNKEGAWIYPLIDASGKPLPLDENNMPIIKMIDVHGKDIPLDDSGRPIDSDGLVITTDSIGRPLDKDGNPFPINKDGYFVVVPGGRATIVSERTPEIPLLIVDGEPIKMDESGQYIDSMGNIIPTDDEGVPLDREGHPLKKNKEGNYVMPPEKITEEGEPLQLTTETVPIKKPDGSPLPTDASGNFITDEGTVIEEDEEGRPLGPDGQVLPTDESGNYIYPLVGPDGQPLPTDEHRRPIHPVVDSDGAPLPTDASGHPLGEDGRPVPTDASGVPLDKDGQPLPTDSSGHYVTVPREEAVSKELPTDESGKVIYPVTKPDGSPLPTDASGNFITDEGTIIEKDEEGRPLGPDGQVLPTDESGNYIYPLVGPDGQPLPTDEHRRPIHPVVDSDGAPLPTDESGHPLGEDGRPVPTDASGVPLDRDGQPLPTDSRATTDESGKVIYPVTKPDGSPLPTDASGNFITDEGTVIEKDEEGRPLGPDGQVLPTDETGNYIYPVVGPDGQPLPTDEHRRPIHPVLGSDGRPLPTDESGHPLGEDGRPVPTDASGVPLDKDGQPLPTDSSGHYVTVPREEAVSKELPTDESGKVIYPVTKPDGSPLPTDASGNFITDEGTIIEKDEEGRPLGPDGQVLPTDETGNYIYPIVGPDGQPLPTDEHRRPIHPVVDSDGRPLPTDESGHPLGEDGRPVPTDASGVPLDKDGQPLPTDNSGHYVTVPREEAVSKELPTDESGKVIYPVTKPDGSPLPTDASGNFITDEGTVIEKDEEGRPLGPDGQVLPTDETGNYIYPIVGPDGQPLPTDEHRRPIHPVVDSDGRPLPTDESGHPLGEDGRPVPTDASGVPLDKDGQPLPTDNSGHYVTVPREEAVSKELPTDESGKVIYPVTKPDGSPLPTDASGNFITDEGTVIEKDEEGRPLGPDGQVLPTDETGNYIYPIVGPDGQPLPTDEHRRPIHPVVDSDGRPLPTDESGHPLGEDGRPVPTDASGVPLDNDGQPLPTDSSGHYVTLLSRESSDTESILKSKQCAIGEPQTETLLFIVESSHQSAPYLTPIKELLKSFIKSIPEESMPKIGKIIYGATTEVTIDIGHYRDKEELVNSFDEIREIGGSPDANLALKIAMQLLMEEERGATVVLHLHVTPLSLRDGSLAEAIREKDVKLVHLDEKSWSTRDSKAIQKFVCLKGIGKQPFVTKPDGSPLPTDASGNFITDEGTIIEKDEEGRPLGPDGQVLPTDESGNYIYAVIGPDGQPLPTDEHRRPIHPVLGSDGRPLPTDESGHPLGEDGRPVPTDASGVPLDKDGQPLPTDSSGHYVTVPREEAVTKELLTDESGKVIYPVTKPDGSPLPTDASGNFITDEGTVIEKDEEGRPLGPDGQVLPTDETGNYIYPVVGPDGQPLPTDEHRRPIHPVLGSDGRPLPTDESGHPLGEDGRPVPTDASGVPLDKDGQPLPTDSSGHYVTVPREEAVTKELLTDESGKVIYPVTKPDGSPLPTDASGNFITDEGTVIEKDEEGRPLGPDGQVLPTDETGNYIYPVVGPDGQPLPTDEHRRPIHPVLGSDGRPLPTDESGHPLGEDGRPVPTDASGVPLDRDGQPLPTDSSGHYVTVPREEAVTKELPTDESGKVIYPVTKPDGSPLPTDASGNFITDEGTVIEKDEEGRPLGPDGQVLPTDETGNYIYPVVGPDGQPLPTDEHRRPIHPVLGSDGRPLPTDESGHPLGEDGRPVPTDASGVPLDRDGQPLPTDSSGHYVTVPREEAVTKELPTDESGKVIYPVTKPDGSPLPTDASGNFITDEGTVIEKDEEGRPLGPDGQVLPTDETGNYIYPVVGPDGQPLPTDEHRRPIHPVLGSDGRPLPTDESGHPLGEDGRPVPTDASGVPLDRDGQPSANGQQWTLRHSPT
ncbi:hypothetical protein RB195_010896 [Necator americanus]|uniref:Fibronectin type III domain protein n=1 Tax=Necator americanus TaxID=51031 RepID=A0ABR1D028_NECAM